MLSYTLPYSRLVAFLEGGYSDESPDSDEACAGQPLQSRAPQKVTDPRTWTARLPHRMKRNISFYQADAYLGNLGHGGPRNTHTFIFHSATVVCGFSMCIEVVQLAVCLVTTAVVASVPSIYFVRGTTETSWGDMFLGL